MASNVDDHYKAGLTCALCRDILTDPRTLPCLHPYCLTCLKGLVEKSGLTGGSFNCPECRHVCYVPQQGVGEFKVSPTITFLLDAYKDSNQTQEPECSICESHEKHTPAKIRCLDCNKRFCVACRKTHDLLLQGHKVLDITGDSANDLQAAFQMVKERTVYCKIHPTKPLEYYCKDDKAALCQSCFVINHSGHPCEDINETAARNMKPIGAVITQGKELIDMYNQGIQNAQAYKSKIEDDIENVIAKIYNDMNMLFEIVRSKYKSFTEQVTHEKQTNVKQVLSHIGHLELNKAVIESQVNKYCNMVEHGHPVEIADLAEQANQKSEEWTKPLEIDFDARIDVQFQVAMCSDAKAEYGKVIVEKIINQNIPVERELKPLCKPSVQKVKLHNENIWGLVGTPTGKYIVAGGTSNAVMYDNTYKLEKDFGKKFIGVTYTKCDNLAVTNKTNSMSIFKPDGTHKHDLVCERLETLWGITMNSVGEFVVCDSETEAVYCVDASTGRSKQQSVAGMFKDPTFVVCNSKDVAIISDYLGHFVKGINRDGTEVFSYGESGDGEGELNTPLGVCTDAEDYIFVADRYNHRVHMLDPHGRFMRYVLTEKDGVYRPNAVTIDHDGNLLVGDCSSINLFIVKYRE